MKTGPSASYSIKFRIKLRKESGQLGKLMDLFGEAGGDIDCVSIVSQNREEVIRDISVFACNNEHQKTLVEAVKNYDQVEVLEVQDCTYANHYLGKMEISARYPLETEDDLAIAYTPGVGRVCMAISDDVTKAYNYTCKANTVAVVSDGTAVLGLGDIGPEAAMPVMEGKSLLFKRFGQVDAFPLCIDTKDTEEIIDFVKKIGPTFGGINLEDISAPRCFEIEERLKAEMDIPVFHDDQHGTAIVTTAALLNALKITGKNIADLKIIVCGVGAAGVACTKMILEAGAKNIIGCDRLGAIYKGRTENMNSMKEWYAENTNPGCLKGELREVLKDADMFVGLSGPGLLNADDIKSMAKAPIVFAMSNPVPEIMPEEAGPHVAVMATGRSDYPNQINNVLAFPGIFRGALDCRASAITEGMKLAAAEAIAGLVTPEELSPVYIIPSPFNPAVGPAVAEAVKKKAIEEGVARPELLDVLSFDQIKR